MPAPDQQFPTGKLDALVERVWTPSPDSPVSVTAGPPPPGHHMVEQYAVVPDLRRARYLVPLGSPRAATASLWTYNSMRAPVRRAGEAALSALFRTRTTAQLFRHRIVVSIDSRVPTTEYGDWLVLDRLAAELDDPRLFACLAVRRVQPNSKPMLELYDDHGRARGFAKLGWSEGTKKLVRSEFEALTEVRNSIRGIIVPDPLCHGSFGEREYSVIAPLPTGLRHSLSDPLAAPEAPLAVTRSAPVSRRPLAGSPYATRLRETLTATSTEAPAVSRELGDWLRRLEQVTVPLCFGRWHGDWVPHNLGKAGPRLAAWDWEHSHSDTPVGFDALHWHYQRGLADGGLEKAVSALDRAAAGLGTHDVPAPARPLTASLYLLEMFLRTTVLAVGGGGWNSRVYPAMRRVATARDQESTNSTPNSSGAV
ncbi:MAG: hypothetical protein L0H93_16670 [Nocardioides sp.]|nr:hypothetical protein [Nocardioides sp.]